jgi:O-antigen ligase
MGKLVYWGEVTLFTPALLALLCCSLLLLDPKALLDFFSSRAAKLVTAAFAFILLISFIQLIVCYNGQLNYLWSSVYWTAIPLFCAVNRREVEKYLPFFLTILGFATLIQTALELIFRRLPVGIPGNWNWNASLIAVTVPFICFVIYKYFRKHYKLSSFIIAVLLITALVLMYYCKSRAAVLGLITACGILIILRYWKKIPGIYWSILGVLLLISGMIFIYLIREYVFIYLKNDQRLLLWGAALDLIGQKSWFGCGPEVFESCYAPCIPIDYYLGRLVSIRHNHAHNHFLYFAATMGIPSLIVWCSVLFYAADRNLRRAVGQGNPELKLYLYIFVLLFVHSMLDIVAVSWPLGCIFLIILGILLGRALDDSKRRDLKINKFTTLSCRIAGIALLVLLACYLYSNFIGTMHYRKAKLLTGQKKHEAAFSETGKSIAAMMSPQNTYLAAMISLYDFKNPQQCLKFLEQLNSLGFENYEHNNLLRAKALVAAGRMPQSLLYFAKEQQNFPLSCVNLYYYRLVLDKLGKKPQANAIGMHLKNLLETKGFSEKMLPELLKDPGKDLRFRSIKDDAK